MKYSHQMQYKYIVLFSFFLIHRIVVFFPCIWFWIWIYLQQLKTRLIVFILPWLKYSILKIRLLSFLEACRQCIPIFLSIRIIWYYRFNSRVTFLYNAHFESWGYFIRFFYWQLIRRYGNIYTLYYPKVKIYISTTLNIFHTNWIISSKDKEFYYSNSQIIETIIRVIILLE